ncbi:hypothetical protein COT12_02825 [Candidatus Berkelbacteria bacterium CG08_land_8_20_14_0_20_39_8]|uniref:Glycosyltransferase 2-like domain-containing protein n=1 Tax=Candidatus Berkelbacteria bacterium CG08_land_8_20_14_0_20_39_8 TaxID=1974511 RepID=A0A2M6YBM9_9BACT|nr:MAG: hypothetical protein COT12_02825 [Candidatus Berkelbacteria bacterium CG08_land_8_20_14_0_20_39_8]
MAGDCREGIANHREKLKSNQMKSKIKTSNRGKSTARLLFSILIPAYKSADIIGETIESILNQTIKNFELIIVDDCSPDDTEKVIKKYQKNDKRIKYFRNEKNLGYSGNLERCRQLAGGKYIYLMGNDDVLSPQALEKTLNAFKMDNDVGVVTRPYYWFENDDINLAVRAVKPLDENEDRLISSNEDSEVFEKVIESVGQLSALAYRREWMDLPIHEDIFPAHIYPFMSIFKKHKAVFLSDYILAVRILSSQTRSLSSIYNPSPTFTWIRMFKTVFAGKGYRQQRKWGIDFIARNYEGLVQIRNYARYRQFLYEVWLLIKYRWENIFELNFWFFFLGLAILPRSIIIPMVDWYKSKLNSRRLNDIHLFIGDSNSDEKYSQKYYVETGMSGFEKDNRMDHAGIIEYGKIKTKDSVLEIGCGLGVLLSKIDAKRKVGLESNEFSVNSCKKKGLNVRQHSNVYKLPFKKSEFDVVIMNEVIEHIPNPPAAVEEAARVLSKKGKLIITTPNKSFLVKNLAETHCSEMTFSELKNLLEENGFAIKKHLVRGLSIWDFVGRKFVFPLGKKLMKIKNLSNSVGDIREKIDQSKMSHFRNSRIGSGCQQLVVAEKK